MTGNPKPSIDDGAKVGGSCDQRHCRLLIADSTEENSLDLGDPVPIIL